MKKLLLSLAALMSGLMPTLAQPTITQQPTNQVVAPGGTMTLSVTVSDPLAAYQWFKDGRLISGATNSTFTVLNADGINSGTYNVVVTNGSGMVISLPALVACGKPTLFAWGYDNDGQLGDGNAYPAGAYVPEIIVVNTVTAAVGDFHSLFLEGDGTLWAMGYNFEGQLGDGTTIERTSPVPVQGGTNVVAIAAGSNYSLFLKSDGTLWAMGNNYWGEMGNGTASGVLANPTPTPIFVASNVVAVAAGAYHSLFITKDGTLWAMGDNFYGQLGNGTTSGANPNPTPMSVASNVVAMAGGEYHSLFLKSDGTLWAMGYNGYGQLGNGTTNNTSLPVNVVAVAAGGDHSLFVTADGTLWAMGYNNDGQLGTGNPLNVSQPALVAGTVGSFANVHSGCLAFHSLAINQPFPLVLSATTQAPLPVTATNAMLNGMVLPSGIPSTAWFEWGPRGSFTQTTTPVNVGSGYGVVRVSTLITGLSSSNVYQCSLVASNSTGVTTGAVQWFRVDQAFKVAAWGCTSPGSYEYGQSLVQQNLTNVVAVAGGAFHSLALQADGTVHAWGQNTLRPIQCACFGHQCGGAGHGLRLEPHHQSGVA